MPLNRTVLIVDDDPQTLASLREILAEKYHLAYATTGAEALAAASRVKPALILLDIALPDIGGLEVCQRLKSREETSATPVIFVTSLNESQMGVDGFRSGAVDYISKPIVPELVLARVESHLSLVQVHKLQHAYREAIAMLSVAGEYNDADTGIHIRRMAAIAAALAKHVGWSMRDVEDLELAAAMHDIGKIGVPSTILKKPGPLNTEEWAIMRRHPQMGSEILSVSDAPLFKMAAEIALNHHERWDGTGYPQGLSGNAIPESARIVALADVFDALTSARPYKEAWSLEATLEYIQAQSGTHFDPELLKLFIAVLPDIIAVKEAWDTKPASR